MISRIKAGVGITRPVYHFEDNKKALRSISSQVHAICKQMFKEGKAECYGFQTPKSLYRKEAWERHSTFLGYDDDFIMSPQGDHLF